MTTHVLFEDMLEQIQASTVKFHIRQIGDVVFTANSQENSFGDTDAVRTVAIEAVNVAVFLCTCVHVKDVFPEALLRTRFHLRTHHFCKSM